jgi:hypothetical protein
MIFIAHNAIFINKHPIVPIYAAKGETKKEYIILVVFFIDLMVKCQIFPTKTS